MITKLQTFFLLTNMYNASRKYKPSVFQKRPFHPMSVSVHVHKCKLRLGKQGSQPLLG